MRRKITRVFDGIDRLLTALIRPSVVFLSLFVATLMVIGIVSRSVFKAPMLGLEELVLFSVIWLYMLGAGLASKERSHLSADFVQVLTKNAQIPRVMRLVATLVSLIMSIAFVIWSFDLLKWGLTKQQSTPVFQLPLYASQASLFVCSLLFVFYVLRDVDHDVENLTEHHD